MGLRFQQPQHTRAEILKEIPCDCLTQYRLKGAIVNGYKLDNNILLSQTIKGTTYSIHLYTIVLHKKQSIYCKDLHSMLGLWHMLEGDATWMLQGSGKTKFLKEESRLIYSPGNLLHHAILDKGVYVMLGVSIPTSLLKLPGAYALQIDYLRNQVEENYDQMMQQMPVKLTDHLATGYHQLIATDYNHTPIDEAATHLATGIFQKYIVGLIDNMRRQGMHDGDVQIAIRIKKYIDNNLSNVLGLKELERIFDLTDATLQKIFKGVYGQTIAAYTQEKRIQLAHDHVLFTADTLTDIAKRCGISNKNLLANFLQRFGVTTRRLRQRGTLVFPD